MNKPIIVSLVALLTALSGVAYFTLKNHHHQMSGKVIPTSADVYEQWQQWLVKYGKTYSHTELPLKYATFSDNYVMIQKFNAQKLFKFTVGTNQFADLSNDEFAAMQKNQLIKKTQKHVPAYIKSDLPTSVDWRTKNAVTPVKNQGQCGSCWAFSTTGSLEGLHAIKTSKLSSFSEQQLVDCSTSYGNQGCNGGLMDYAFNYTSSYGIESESTYPYTGQDGTCAYKKSATLFTNKGWSDVASNQSAALKTALASQPVSVAIEADSFSFQFYSGGIYNDASCGTNLDHGVLAVGYDTTQSTPYYIVKNSWDSTWGDQGYINIAIKDGPGICGIQMQASYPTA